MPYPDAIVYRKKAFIAHAPIARRMSTTDEMIINRVWTRQYPPGVRENIAIPDLSVHEYFLRTSDEFAGNTACVFLERAFSYREVREYSLRVAAGLASMGIGKGDRVALILPNSVQFVASYLGALCCGAVVVPINPLYKQDVINYILADSEARVVITLDILYDTALAASRDTRVERIVSTNIADFLPRFKKTLGILLKKIPARRVPSKGSSMRFSSLLRSQPITRAKVAKVDVDEDLAVICYTSGTTGLPKGAMLTHRNLVADMEISYEMLHPKLERGKEVVLALLPFFHIYSQTTIMLLGLTRGFTLIVIPRPDIGELLRILERYGITLFCGVPSLYTSLMKAPGFGRHLLRSVKFCISGADKLHPEIAKRFSELTGIEILEGYGLTEASPVTHINPFNRVKRGSIGVPIPNTYAWVISMDNNAFLDRGVVGELVVSGPQVMKGYLKREKETEEAFFRALGRRWLRTGDLGYVDEEGYFYVVERKKDLIKHKGWSIYPAEVENAVLKHEAIESAAVVGVPDIEVGERIVLYVVLRSEYRGKLTEEEILRWCRENLSRIQVPERVIFRDELPLTITGKVLRRELREEAIRTLKR